MGLATTTRDLRKTARRIGTIAPPPTQPTELDSAEARSRQILVAMVAFRDGDFSLRLPTHWKETDGQIAAAFNQTIAQEARIAAEVARLSASVGKEGRLKHRMSVPGTMGDWATKIDAINALMDR